MERRAVDLTGIRFTLQERSIYRFWLLVTQVQRCLAAYYVGKFGRPANAWRVFSVIGDRSEISPSEVARLTQLERDKITRIADQLVAQGLMRRNQKSADKRRVSLTLTAKGKRVNSEMDTARRAIEEEFLGALDPWEREALYRLLDKLQERATTMFEGKQAWRKFDPNLRRKSAGGRVRARRK
jgi:DNA-binding MarR family transcriptional regulator